MPLVARSIQSEAIFTQVGPLLASNTPGLALCSPAKVEPSAPSDKIDRFSVRPDHHAGFEGLDALRLGHVGTQRNHLSPLKPCSSCSGQGHDRSKG
jgi:hypothetical protein